MFFGFGFSLYIQRRGIRIQKKLVVRFWPIFYTRFWFVSTVALLWDILSPFLAATPRGAYLWRAIDWGRHLFWESLPRLLLINIYDNNGSIFYLGPRTSMLLGSPWRTGYVSSKSNVVQHSVFFKVDFVPVNADPGLLCRQPPWRTGYSEFKVQHSVSFLLTGCPPRDVCYVLDGESIYDSGWASHQSFLTATRTQTLDFYACNPCRSV